MEYVAQIWEKQGLWGCRGNIGAKIRTVRKRAACNPGRLSRCFLNRLLLGAAEEAQKAQAASVSSCGPKVLPLALNYARCQNTEHAYRQGNYPAWLWEHLVLSSYLDQRFLKRRQLASAWQSIVQMDPALPQKEAQISSLHYSISIQSNEHPYPLSHAPACQMISAEISHSTFLFPIPPSFCHICLQYGLHPVIPLG